MSPLKSTPREPPPTPPDGEEGGPREALAQLMRPLGLVLLTRERIQAVLDEAVLRGRVTRTDAADLAAALVERGRRQTEDLIADAEQLLGRSPDALQDGSPHPRSFPVAGYDDLTAAQVTGRLGELTPADLRKVRDYERRNANRKSVLAAVERRLA